MTHKASGLWCDLCGKPLMGDEPYWHCTVNGKPNCHSCEKCKIKVESGSDESGACVSSD